LKGIFIKKKICLTETTVTAKEQTEAKRRSYRHESEERRKIGWAKDSRSENKPWNKIRPGRKMCPRPSAYKVDPSS
jgi:hypothetical protein